MTPITKGDEDARDFLGSFIPALFIAAAIFAIAWSIGAKGRNAGETWRESCSTITLSTPDGKTCFPKHHDRSRIAR